MSPLDTSEARVGVDLGRTRDVAVVAVWGPPKSGQEDLGPEPVFHTEYICFPWDDVRRTPSEVSP